MHVFKYLERQIGKKMWKASLRESGQASGFRDVKKNLVTGVKYRTQHLKYVKERTIFIHQLAQKSLPMFEELFLKLRAYTTEIPLISAYHPLAENLNKIFRNHT